MKKKPTSVILSKEHDDFLKSHPDGRTEVIKNALSLFAGIDYNTIKELAGKHRVHPDLLVDAAVLYFSKLSKKEQADKLIDYLDIMKKEAEREERGEK